jgi:CubicO group peptidase (beta-lactamase class C family)
MILKILTKTLITASLGAVVLIGNSFVASDSESFGNNFTAPEDHPSSFHITNFYSEQQEFKTIEKQVKRFMKREHMIGASVAIAKEGKLVYAKGFGYADRENEVPVEPYHLFRIASVSKLVTAVGIFKLIEEGALSLDSRVFGPDGILNDSVYLKYRDKKVENITVLNLLNHSGGWTTRWGDPMFMPTIIARKLHKQLPVSSQDIIQFVLSKRLHFKPGTMSYYSNFGFMVLGEVIKKVSGMPYEEYIQTHVLYPQGIFDMRIGGSYLKDRYEFEVKYYEPEVTYYVDDYNGSGKKVLRSYGGNDMKTLGAAGGWIASSTDLLKLMLAIDDMPTVKDMLTEEDIKKMVTPVSPGMSPLGWRRVNRYGWFRTGTLAGTSALMVRKPDGISYTVLFNTGNWKGPRLATDIYRMMERGIRGINEWPEYDLFELDRVWASRKHRPEVIF